MRSVLSLTRGDLNLKKVKLEPGSILGSSSEKIPLLSVMV